LAVDLEEGASMSTGLWVVIGIAVVLGAWVVGIYNGLVRVKNQVANAWRQIDVQLKRRHDLIPNLVEVVKDYMSYEQETLRQVIEARNKAVSATTPSAAIPAETALTGAVGRLFALMENYPQLKANENVSRLMEELATTENKIAFARQFYNDSAMANNNRVESFPSNLIAGRFGFKTAPYFEVPEGETAAPKVNLR
jgi:LemA protein